jgi:DNA transposition AAA+ family ATPase
MGAIHGEAGTGKTFAVEDALACSPGVDACWLSFPSRPTMRLVAAGLLAALTRTTPAPERNRFQATHLLLDVLAHERWVIVVDEAQRLNRECIEYLRHLHDHPMTHFALLLVGGDGCWEVLSHRCVLRTEHAGGTLSVRNHRPRYGCLEAGHQRIAEQSPLGCVGDGAAPD